MRRVVTAGESLGNWVSRWKERRVAEGRHNGLEEKTKLVTRGVDVRGNINVAIHLDVCRTGIPFALHGVNWWCTDLVKFSRHVLLLWDSVHCIVVHENLQSFLIDADSTSNFGGFDIHLHCDASNKLFDGAVHEVHSAEVVIVGLSTSESGLYVKTCDRLEHGLGRRLVCLVNAQCFNPSR
jgi:hypothetical protein